MEKFIPYQKLSKKERKKVNNLKRKDWNGFDHKTKIVRDKTLYSRKVKHKGTED
jgi:hypothetical protein